MPEPAPRRLQTHAGVIRVRLRQIEASLAAGLRYEALVADLAKEGYPMSLETFRTTLKRERRRLRSVEPGTPDAAPSRIVTPAQEGPTEGGSPASTVRSKTSGFRYTPPGPEDLGDLI